MNYGTVEDFPEISRDLDREVIPEFAHRGMPSSGWGSPANTP
jgi:hypothetical protein